jgi:hypothetical protein
VFTFSDIDLEINVSDIDLEINDVSAPGLRATEFGHQDRPNPSNPVAAWRTRGGRLSRRSLSSLGGRREIGG